jgi:cyclopropane-fatty-acyl-phospholipid synthase
VAQDTDLRMVSLEDITPHYVETLRHWRANVEAATPRLRELGYDARFQRLWRLYLCFCEAGFAERRIGDVQIVLAKPRWRGHVTVAEPAAPPAAVSECVESAS